MTACCIQGCGRSVKARGWCEKHYRRWVRTGSAEWTPRCERRVDSGCLPCTRCQTVKSVDEFKIDKRNVSGYSSWCLTCAAEDGRLKYDPEAEAARQRRRQDADPDGFRRHRQDRNRARRARFRNAFVEHVDKSLVWQRDEGICGICHEPADPADWHLDHVIPISRGGAHSRQNVQVSHPFCNRSKRNKLPQEVSS